MYKRMSEDALDVKSAEASAAGSSSAEGATDTKSESSSEDVNAPEDGSGKVVSSTVPRERLNKEIERRKGAEDLLQTYLEVAGESVKGVKKPEAETVISPVAKNQFSSAQDWQDYIAVQKDAAIAEAEKRAHESIRRELEHREVTGKDDFLLYKDSMIQEVKKNPTINPLDAYYLAKAKHPVFAEKARQEIEAQVRVEVEQKQRAQVGGQKARVKGPELSVDLVTARDNGKYKYSLRQIEEMLKGAK